MQCDFMWCFSACYSGHFGEPVGQDLLCCDSVHTLQSLRTNGAARSLIKWTINVVPEFTYLLVHQNGHHVSHKYVKMADVSHAKKNYWNYRISYDAIALNSGFQWQQSSMTISTQNIVEADSFIILSSTRMKTNHDAFMTLSKIFLFPCSNKLKPFHRILLAACSTMHNAHIADLQALEFRLSDRQCRRRSISFSHFPFADG